MNKGRKLMESYAIGVQHPEVSGFELLELLDVRSQIARLEGSLSGEARRKLEEADRHFLENATAFYTRIAEVADLAAMRAQAEVPPSHWWWYLEELVRVTTAEERRVI